MHDLLSQEAVRLLRPLIGMRARVQGRTLELLEVLAEGPCVALMDTTSSPRIRVDQYGGPLSRQPRILTIPILSAVEGDAHPVLRALLPDTVLRELRDMIRISG
jgi:hypothetical protein